jgi:UDP:flavonoid glycosyltransferase YjiC (YdhE family)
MQVLLTSLPLYSHVMSMVVPVARALQAAGHQVAVATGPALTGDLDRLGLPHRPMPRMLAPAQMASDPDFASRIGLGPDGMPLPELGLMDRGAAFGRLFAGLTAVRAAEDMLAATSSFRPDLVVRECTEFGGYLLAGKLGIPCVTLDNAPLVPTRHPGLLPWLNESRAALGLAPADGTSALTRGPWISWIPQAWYPEELRTAAYRYYQAPPGPAAGLDPAIAQLPTGEPFVLATLGSLTGNTLSPETTPLPHIVEALGTLPCTAVVALGRDADPADWTGPRPGNVHLASFVQQQLLLPACDLFLTHAGFGGIREALTAGVPMVALPLNADQPVNAQRLAELGVGAVVSRDKADSPTLAAACRKVLDDPSYRLAARGFQRQILGLPGIDQLVADLTALAA